MFVSVLLGFRIVRAEVVRLPVENFLRLISILKRHSFIAHTLDGSNFIHDFALQVSSVDLSRVFVRFGSFGGTQTVHATVQMIVAIFLHFDLL